MLDNARELVSWSLFYQSVPVPFPSFPEISYCFVVISVAIVGELCNRAISKPIIPQEGAISSMQIPLYMLFHLLSI